MKTPINARNGIKTTNNKLAAITSHNRFHHGIGRCRNLDSAKVRKSDSLGPIDAHERSVISSLTSDGEIKSTGMTGTVA